MEGGRGRDPLSLLGGPLPRTFEVRVLGIAPGRVRTFAEAEWRDALVVVQRGEIDLEWVDGTRHCFRKGDVLWLIGLKLRAIHNRGTEPALIVAVARRRRSSPSQLVRGNEPRFVRG